MDVHTDICVLYAQVYTKFSHIRLGIDVSEMGLQSLRTGGFDTFFDRCSESCFPVRWTLALSKGGINNGTERGSKFVCKFLVDFDGEVHRCNGTFRFKSEQFSGNFMFIDKGWG